MFFIWFLFGIFCFFLVVCPPRLKSLSTGSFPNEKRKTWVVAVKSCLVWRPGGSCDIRTGYRRWPKKTWRVFLNVYTHLTIALLFFPFAFQDFVRCFFVCLGVAVKNLWRLLVRKIYKNFRIILLSNVNYCFYSRPSLSLSGVVVCALLGNGIADNQHLKKKLFTNSSDKIKKRWPSSVRTNIMSRTISTSYI